MQVKTAEDAAGRLALVKAEAAKRLAVELEATKAKDAAAVEEAVRAEMDRQVSQPPPVNSQPRYP